MASQTITVNNLGQAGYLPDTSVTVLPPNAFTYSRNFTFHEGDYAEVSRGYTNALESRGGKTTLGDSDTNATFMYTWRPVDSLVFFYYDANTNKMFFVEDNTDGNTEDTLLEYDLCINEIYSAQYQYIEGNANTTLDPGQFTYDTDLNEFYINPITADSSEFTDRNQDADVVLQIRNIAGDDDDTGMRTEITKVTGTPALNANISGYSGYEVNSADTDKVDVSNFTDSENYIFSYFKEFDLDPENEYVWEGIDALGIPIFSNEKEEPWEYVETPLPHLQRMTNWPVGGYNKGISSFGNYLVGVGYINDSDGVDDANKGNTRTLAISDVIVNAGVLPDWDFDSDDSHAQLIDLSLYTQGDLVSAYEANGQLIVNTTGDVLVITDQGEGTFSATKLPLGTGVYSKRTSVPIPNGFFNIGNGVFYTHDGNSYTEVGDGQWRDSWFAAVDEERRDEIQVIYDARGRNVKIKTPTSGIEQQVWTYNLDNNTMSVQDDHQEVKYMLWTTEGIPSITSSWDSFSSDDQWDELEEDSWNDFPVPDLGEYHNRVISVGGREIYVHDFGTSYNGRDIDAVLQRQAIRLKDNSYGSFQIQRVIPWVDEAGGDSEMLDIRVGFSRTPEAEVIFTGYQTYTTGVDEKLDFRSTGKWGAITLRSGTSGMKISGYQLEVGRAEKR